MHRNPVRHNRGGDPHAAERQCDQRKQASDSRCADDVQRECRAGEGDRPRGVVLNAIETRGDRHGFGRVPADDRQAGEDGEPGADGEQQRRNPGIYAEGAGDRHRDLRTPEGKRKEWMLADPDAAGRRNSAGPLYGVQRHARQRTRRRCGADMGVNAALRASQGGGENSTRLIAATAQRGALPGRGGRRR